jgi:hypothetical protein
MESGTSEYFAWANPLAVIQYNRQQEESPGNMPKTSQRLSDSPETRSAKATNRGAAARFCVEQL